uniref:Na+/H+ antiporter NhaC family protein n=1 Tax=Faecalicatena contorta TaxID=39482 RepID=UPI00359C704E
MADCVSYSAGINKIGIYKHIKLLTVPVVLATVLTIIFYAVCGMKFTSSGIVSLEAVEALRGEIAANFNISILCILPLVIAIVLCFLKTPPAVALFTSGFIAVIVGVITQKFSFLAGLEAAWSGFDSSILKNENLSGNIISFLNRGGSFSMADSILFMVIAMITMEILGGIGVFTVIRNSLFKNVTNSRHLTITTAVFSSIFTVITTNSWTSCAVTTEAMRDSYHRAGFSAATISAVTAACTYMVEQFLPWAFLAIYSASVFGVTVGDYVPWAVFFPFVTVITVILYSIRKLETLEAED